MSYVVNRNINYTNVCTFKCQFCAFSKGKARFIICRREHLGVPRWSGSPCVRPSPARIRIHEHQSVQRRSPAFGLQNPVPEPLRPMPQAAENLRGAPYLLSMEEITRRTAEAHQRGATEVCMQARPRWPPIARIAGLRIVP